jgi:hypothetical protein
MKAKILVVLMTTALCCIWTPSQASGEQSSETNNTLDRTTLPIKEPSYQAIT